MSFMNPIDMVDEDAADLQFPKGNRCAYQLTHKLMLQVKLYMLGTFMFRMKQRWSSSTSLQQIESFQLIL